SASRVRRVERRRSPARPRNPGLESARGERHRAGSGPELENLLRSSWLDPSGAAFLRQLATSNFGFDEGRSTLRGCFLYFWDFRILRHRWRGLSGLLFERVDLR